LWWVLFELPIAELLLEFDQRDVVDIFDLRGDEDADKADQLQVSFPNNAKE